MLIQQYQGFLSGKRMTYRIFISTPDQDHEHCNFCGAKFSPRERDLWFGYAPSDASSWVCPECFALYRESYGFSSEPAAQKPYAEILDGLARRYRASLAEQFIGLYVHGSIAMGCFNPQKSDIDLILVCDDEPADEIKYEIMTSTLQYAPFAPAKGIEMHLMRLADCQNPRACARFCLHSSPMHEARFLANPKEYIAHMRGDDPDLAAHCAVVKARGRRLAGAPIEDVFADVPRAAFLQSVRSDADWADGNAMYHVLNRCRTLAYLENGGILSKREGGEWALEHLPARYAELIRDALDCYASDREMPPSTQARAFCAHALDMIAEKIEKENAL